MKELAIIKRDATLKPFERAILGRYQYALQKELQLTGGQKLKDFANGYFYFGLHKLPDGWVFREWAPNATAIYLIGDANGWKKDEAYRLYPVGGGNWEVKLKADQLQHGQLYKLLVEWQGGWGERIPSYATRVTQDSQTKIFSAQVWTPQKPYKWHNKKFIPQKSPLFIYECHIGMSSEEEKVSSYEEFRQTVLPRVAALGYNCIQLMAIQEHPYYGSFGYHVSNFFAASSRFGTPEELKRLIDEAHGLGIAVIMDLVHSHAVKNEREGLARFDGTHYQYFHDGSRGLHPAWDSYCFDYGKPEVMHFLLSNCKYWLDEFKFDGFRFDGVTSMIYLSHGLGQDFASYADYYNLNEDGDAICYLTLANKLIHEYNKHAITIAEEMSGMPGLACPFKDGGMGFDYRLAMGQPDFWIKMIQDVRDEDWKAGHILYEMTNRRADEKTISYAESHDQALVGDKTIIFRLVDADMYWHFEHGHDTYMVNRGIALHKMIRLMEASTMNGGYLTFMGNEFGHPEWIDFPREGNGWSCKYARRQWSLVDNKNYFFADLNRFDERMVHLLSSINNFSNLKIENLWDKEDDQVVAFQRDKYIFVFNWNGSKSFPDYGILAPEGEYEVVLNTDAKEFAGFALSDDSIAHFTQFDAVYSAEHKGWLKLYLPARSALILKKVEKNLN